ncbi:GAF domain-containing protein [Danxiaibacter flavus]|uniref:GAF domain-containing protein n=1 Tax=Danxiaibacter flavus TaxID=3049108 RepID=A0ABV3ZIV1_9BACT|nr:GAF domain-containing protein [Chitinophagaceae bacterium DXS]
MNSDDFLQHTRESAVNGQREQQLGGENYRFNMGQVPIQIEAKQNTTNKYLTLFNNMEQGFCIIEVLFDDAGTAIDYRFLETNPVFEKQTGLQNAIGKTIKELEPGQEEHWFQIYGDVVKTGKSVHFENEASNLIGGVWYEVFAVPIDKPEKKQVAVFFNDITERKKAEDRHAFLIKLNEALRQIGDAVQVQAVAADLLGEHLKANQSHYGEVVGDYVYINHSYGDGLPAMTGKFRHQDFGECMVDGYCAGKVQVSYDTTTDPVISGAERAVLALANKGAYIAVPLVKKGEWVAILAVHNIKPRRWKQSEIDLVQEVAERTWEAVERAKAEELLTRELEDTKKLQQFSNRVIEENNIEAL